MNSFQTEDLANLIGEIAERFRETSKEFRQISVNLMNHANEVQIDTGIFRSW
jgi:hypothetical protein